MIALEHRELLLTLARNSIQEFLEPVSMPFETKIPTELYAKSGVFVTLTKNKQLRGCIGSLGPSRTIWNQVKQNALLAAFSDSRFSPVEPDEVPLLKIQISVLSPPKPFFFYTVQELLHKLENEKPGVILSKDAFSATFLPSVWKEIQTSEEFLSELCQKAGLGKNEWKQPGLKIQLYFSESFEEK
ncbi:MAG: AmmeMemoRadiSam system protein A [Candidatus Diapherotrites archaeon]|uniref:AmmeMemoRadiSam system protein A n=1 Tax=Candidatus Iainarchaeum sp. TaxID=3101447 RepID=A0A8T4L9K2_9ARCH|nr:AmmeMemoRadiSam system protein A [Candidatus Diapherotrites archaeon]